MDPKQQEFSFLLELYRVNRKLSLLHAIEGIDITRCAEYCAAWRNLRATLGQGRCVVLDLGSYRSPWPVYLARQGHRAIALDRSAMVMKQAGWANKAGCRSHVLPLVADALRIPLADNAADVATAISTLEHIEADGDTRALAEVCRALKPGGLLFVSVPYAACSMTGRWGRWFQRWYNDSEASRRLIDPLPVAEEGRGYLLGGTTGRLADIWYRLPARLRHCFSWSHIAWAWGSELTGDRSDARVLWLVLRKRTAGPG